MMDAQSSTMQEAEYWLRLEYRTCREFEGMREKHLCFLWCDGFLPKEYILADPAPRITGTTWICNGSKQAEWEFTLFLPHACGSHEEIEWPSLLPPEEVTCWLALDAHAQRIQIEPAAAVPDEIYATSGGLRVPIG